VVDKLAVVVVDDEAEALPAPVTVEPAVVVLEPVVLAEEVDGVGAFGAFACA
jgi:hypothetical protein